MIAVHSLHGVAMTIGTYGDLARDFPEKKLARTWNLFLVLIAVASLLPFALMPLAAHVIPDGKSLSIVLAITFLGANFHVAMTGWFYTDPEMRGHFRSRPMRYLLIPAILVPAGAALYAFAEPTIRVYLIATFLGWQLWHYQKQNIGLLSFIAAGTDRTPLSIWERRTLAAAAIPGIMGFFSLAGLGGVGFAAGFKQLHQVAIVFVWVLPVLFCLAVIKTPALRSNRLRLVFFSFGTLFSRRSSCFPISCLRWRDLA